MHYSVYHMQLENSVTDVGLITAVEHGCFFW